MFKLLKINEARKDIAALEAKLTDADAQVAEAQEERLYAVNHAQDLQAQIAEQKIDIASLNDALEEADAHSDEIKAQSLKAAEAAVEIVAQCGAEEPLQAETQAELSNDELWSEYHGLTSATEKVDFYRKHRNKLLNKE